MYVNITNLCTEAQAMTEKRKLFDELIAGVNAMREQGEEK